MVADHLLGEREVCLKQGLRRTLHGYPGQSAHLRQLVDQGIELLVVSGPHQSSVLALLRAVCSELLNVR